jgi:hypothetical protein
MTRRPEAVSETNRHDPDRLTAAATLLLGLIVVVAAQVIAPIPGPPLYDGVIPTGPYLWLSPPPGAQGGAQGASTALTVTGGSSPLVTLATPELVPQAQMLATPGSLILPPGTTSLKVSITPVPPDAQPTDGHLAGNVYRILITTQAGVAVSAPASAEVSVILRSPDATATDATMARLVNGAWQPLDTAAPGAGATFVGVVTDFGDFALIESGPAASGLESPGASAAPSGGLPNSPAPSASAGPLQPGSGGGIPTITIVAGIASVLLLVALIALAVVPRKPRRREWGESPNRRSRRR